MTHEGWTVFTIGGVINSETIRSDESQVLNGCIPYKHLHTQTNILALIESQVATRVKRALLIIITRGIYLLRRGATWWQILVPVPTDVNGESLFWA